MIFSTNSTDRVVTLTSDGDDGVDGGDDGGFAQEWASLDKMARLVFETKVLDGDNMLETWDDTYRFGSAIFKIPVPGPSSSGRTHKPRDRSSSRPRPGSSRRRDPKLNEFVLDSDDDDEDQLGHLPKHPTGPYDCPRMVHPTPPPTQSSKEADSAAAMDHVRHCALNSKNYIRAHRTHGHFGKQSNSVRGVSIVQRGAKLTPGQIQRWMQHPKARADSVDTFYNADKSYYKDDGYHMNPKKVSVTRRYILVIFKFDHEIALSFGFV